MQIIKAEHPLHTALTQVHDTFVENSSPSNYHKTPFWGRDMIAVSLDDQNYAIRKHTFQIQQMQNLSFVVQSINKMLKTLLWNNRK